MHGDLAAPLYDNRFVFITWCLGCGERYTEMKVPFLLRPLRKLIERYAEWRTAWVWDEDVSWWRV